MYEVSLERSYFPAQNSRNVKDLSVGDALKDAVMRAAGAEALVEVHDDGSTGRRWSYQKLLDDSLILARWLAGRFERNDRLAIWAANSPEWVIFEYACAFAGVTLVTVNPSFQARELHYVLEQSESVALFLIDNYRGNPMGEIASRIKSDLPNLREMIQIDQMMDIARAGDVNQALPTVTPDDIAQIQYTSGTTGFPKGALLHHRGLVNNARHLFLDSKVPERVKMLNVFPLFHTAGCALSVLGCMQILGSLYMVPIFIPDVVNKLVEEEKLDVASGVPTMLTAMLESYNRIPRDFSHVKTSLSGGSMVSPELRRAIEAAWDVNLVTVYGQTEASPLITMSRPEDSQNDLCYSIGQPMPNVDVAIKDPKTHEVLPLDTQGEICCRGYLNMVGYNNNPEATAETIDEEGWLYTGDLGTMDARGYLKITGRVKEMIIRGGENLFPAEIENILLEHPDVIELAVVGLPDEKFGEIVGAFIRLHDDATADPETLKAHCRAHISPQKTPTVWVFVEEFPLTGSGKIKRFELRDRWIEGEFS